LLVQINIKLIEVHHVAVYLLEFLKGDP